MTDVHSRSSHLLDGHPLPKALHEWREDLYAAFKVPLLAEWPEGEELRLAEPAAAIGKILVRALHDELDGAKIAYLFKETMAKGDRIDLGHAKRTTGPLAFLTEYDFVVILNWSHWKLFDNRRRVALLDHELSHCGRDDDGKWITLHHDVEEFSGVVGRWGLWTHDLETFGRAVKVQLEIFGEAK